MLLDLSLPDGDGRDICRQLRGESDVPIIMVTASGTVTDRVVGLELGADDYVVKPFAIGEVVARIRAVLRRGRVRDGDARRCPPRRAATRPRRTARLAGGPRARADAQGVRPARSARPRRRPGRHARDADVRRLGPQLVRLDQDPRRPHRVAAPQARRRPGSAVLHPHRPRRRVSVSLRIRRRSRGPRDESEAPPAGGADVRAAAGDHRARRAARGQPERTRQRGGPDAGAGTGRPRRGDRGGPARADGHGEPASGSRTRPRARSGAGS